MDNSEGVVFTTLECLTRKFVWASSASKENQRLLALKKVNDICNVLRKYPDVELGIQKALHVNVLESITRL